PRFVDALMAQNANGWQDDAALGCTYERDGYHSYTLIRAVHECFADATPTFRCATGFAVQVEVAFLHGDGGGGLVLCSTVPGVPYYRFVVRPDGYFDLYDPATGHRTTVGFASPSTRYLLTAIVQASTIYLYVSGVSVGDGSLESGASSEGGRV